MSSAENQDASREGQPEELRTNARLLSLIYDSTSDPVYLVRIEGGGQYRFVSVNESFLRVTGYPVGQVIGAPMEYVVPGPNVALVRSQYERAIAARQPILYEEKAELPAGTRYAEITLIPIFEGGGPVTHILGDVKDITARQIAEMEREQLLANAVFLSDATRLLASLDIEQALGDMARLSVPYLGDGCAVASFGEGGGPRRVVAIARDPRNPMFVEVHPTVLGGNALIYRIGSAPCLGVPLLIKGHLTGAVTIRAPSDRKYTSIDLQLVEELGRRAAMAIDNARLYRRAQEALRAREAFLSIAAHEIRGPLTSIHLAVQAFRQEKLRAGGPVPRVRAHRAGRSAALQLRRRAPRLRPAARGPAPVPARGGQPDGRRPGRREAPRRRACRLAGRRSRCPRSRTSSDNGTSLGSTRWSRNLLSNAIKFGLGKPIEISISALAGRARLSVRDHGIGIDPHGRERIFKPFERNVSARHYGGLGLGLHIVKTVVIAMGGSVSLESELGAGSTFIVELPLQLTSEVSRCVSS